MNKYDLTKIVHALKNGFLIVYPTETLYGIGADIYNEEAVKKVFKIKNRSFSKPLSVAVSKKDVEKLAYVNDVAEKLIDHFLPGPLTLILKKKDCPDIVTGGLDKVGVRIPDNRFTLELIEEFGPITSTSANIHGCNTPSKINDIKKRLDSENIKFFIDEGALSGSGSTIVDVSFKKVRILRDGNISRNDILEVIED